MMDSKCVLLSLLVAAPLAWAAGFQGIPGNFCRFRRPSECCTTRNDDCAVPIRGTMCYCDEFCLNKDDNSGHDDCCPDFKEVCLGISPPDPFIDWPQRDQPQQGCEVDRVQVPHLGTYKSNCNECKCVGTEVTCEEDECLVEEEVIKRINHGRGTYTWTAGNYTKFWGRKITDSILLRTGALPPSFKMHPIHLRPDPSLIPRVFDSRQKQGWSGVISSIYDQGWCAASWAFSSLAVFQDRLGILTREPNRLSLEQVVGCVGNGNSCTTGEPIDTVWNYIRRTGVVPEKCLPYYSWTGITPECKVPRGDTSRLTCQQPSLYKSEPAYRISSNEDDIKWEIMTNGPVQAMMRVSRDLFIYKSGVYTCAPDAHGLEGQHAVRLVGWGEEVLQWGRPPTKYWLVANSWGTDWGERGYFRIRRGTNECDIESYVVASRPRLAGFSYGY